MRCPTLAMRPPTCTSALYPTRVFPPSASESSMAASPRTKPGAPVPSTAMRYLFGGSRSDRRTLPSKVPLIGPTPTFMVALYSPGAISSSFSHPGIAFASVAGSWKASQTRCRGAGISAEPSIFMSSSSSLEGTDRGVHARDAFLDRLETRGVREADVGVRPEIDAGDRRDARLVQQEGAHIGGPPEHAALGALAEQSGHVRKRVEGALGHPAAKARHGVEPRDTRAPPAI